MAGPTACVQMQRNPASGWQCTYAPGGGVDVTKARAGHCRSRKVKQHYKRFDDVCLLLKRPFVLLHWHCAAQRGAAWCSVSAVQPQHGAAWCNIVLACGAVSIQCIVTSRLPARSARGCAGLRMAVRGCAWRGGCAQRVHAPFPPSVSGSIDGARYRRLQRQALSTYSCINPQLA